MSMITPITVEGFPQYARPWNNITPFTYRDGLTYLEVLEGMRLWLKDILVPHIDKEMDEIGNAWNQEVLALIAAVDAAMVSQSTSVTEFMSTIQSEINARADQWMSGNIENNDGITATLIDDGNSTTRASLDYGFLNREVTFTDADTPREALRIIDNTSGEFNTFRIEDSAAHGASQMNLHHRGDGSNGAQTFGINIANHNGAKSAFVIHQYSDAGPAVQIDNTDIATAIYIKNTQNTTMNPDGTGTGAFLQLLPYGEAQSLQFTNDLIWLNRSNKDMRVWATNPSIYGFGVQVDTDKIGLYVSKRGTGGSAAIDVLNKGTGAGINVSQQGAGTALRVTQLVAGQYGGRIDAVDYGQVISLSGDSGVALDVTKNGTGAGTGIRIINKGTGSGISILNATTQVFRVGYNGEIETYTPGTGVVMRSPNGTRYRVTVSDAGALTAAVA